MWDIPSLNMLERITIVNLMLFKYIWNNCAELVKRETLILSYENVRISMFHLESRLKTLSLQSNLYIRKNCNRVFYQ